MRYVKWMAKPLILVVFLLGLPLLGVWLAGKDVSLYLEFPPLTRYVEHAPFSWTMFAVMGLIVLVALVPLFYGLFKYPGAAAPAASTPRAFPWWGKLGLLLAIPAWVLAWTRFSWFKAFQLHTFFPLWLSYILVVNALTYRRSGRCMLLDRKGYFWSLFPLSAAFWWFFEYLNRFVQNWYYLEVASFSRFEYFLMATLCFSTVLPAVLGTAQWLQTYPLFNKGLDGLFALRVERKKGAAALVALPAGLGLTCIGIWPDYLYPLLWVAPLLLITSFQALAGQKTIFYPLEQGNWSRLYRLAFAALICGFFWEMWNYYSLSKWVYAVPFVYRFKIFEMPLMGYAGYLPFGLECAVIAYWLTRSPADLEP